MLRTLFSSASNAMVGRENPIQFTRCKVPEGLFDGPSCSQSNGLTARGGLRGGGASPTTFFTTANQNLQHAGLLLARTSQLPAVEKCFRIVKVAPDGRCMFRALAKGLQKNRGSYLGGDNETKAADELRLAVHEALCTTSEKRKRYDHVRYSVEHFDGGFRSYCARLRREDFWGGEVEISVLSRMLHQPIYIYQTADETGRGSFGYVPIARHGEEYAHKKGKAPVRLLYSHGNHYDLLL